MNFRVFTRKVMSLMKVLLWESFMWECSIVFLIQVTQVFLNFYCLWFKRLIISNKDHIAEYISKAVHDHK